MRKIKLLLAVAVSLLLIPLAYQVQSAQKTVKAPPVDPVLVRQGDFALSLVEILELGTSYSEAQAQEMLSEIGIEPVGGWISDFPMTPGIIGELKEALERAEDNGYLDMNLPEALNRFQNLTVDYGLPISPDYERKPYSETAPPFGYYEYTDPVVINQYYYLYGAPIITYYPPPSGFYSRYIWVSYPFWWDGFWFSGYFLLNDFHRNARIVILSRTGTKGHRSPRNVMGVISNRTKKYHGPGRFAYPKNRVLHSPSRPHKEKYDHPEKRKYRRYPKPHDYDALYRNRVIDKKTEQRNRFNGNSTIQKIPNRSFSPPVRENRRNNNVGQNHRNGFSSDKNRSFQRQNRNSSFQLFEQRLGRQNPNRSVNREFDNRGAFREFPQRKNFSH